MLRDPTVTRMSWVTHAGPMALEETADALAALRGRGIRPRRADRQPARPASRPSRASGATRAAGSRHGRSRRSCAGCRISSCFGLPEFGANRVVRRRWPRSRPALRPLVPGPRPAPPAHRVTVAVDRGQRPQRRRRWCRASHAGCSLAAKEGSARSTCAAAYAIDVALADPARRVLLISTDPAHSLGDVLGHRVDDEPRSVPGGPVGLRRAGDRRCGVPRPLPERYLGAWRKSPDGSGDPHRCPTRSMPFVS